VAVGERITFRAACVDGDGDLAGAEWYVDGMPVAVTPGPAAGASGWEMCLPLALDRAGLHVVEAQPFDERPGPSSRGPPSEWWVEARGPPPEGSLAFRDDFEGDCLDATRWDVSRGDGPVSCAGRPWCFDPANVRVENGTLALTLRAGSLSGAELRTRALFGVGTFEIRARLSPTGAGGLFAFFTYLCEPHVGEEIDFIEIPMGSPTFASTAWDGPDCRTQIATREAPLLLADPGDGFHTYRFERAPGALLAFVDGVPANALALVDPGRGGERIDRAHRLHVSFWAPRWTEPRFGQDAVVLVDRVEAVAAPWT
jgi:hypothetical protein